MFSMHHFHICYKLLCGNLLKFATDNLSKKFGGHSFFWGLNFEEQNYKFIGQLRQKSVLIERFVFTLNLDQFWNHLLIFLVDGAISFQN